jgi:hypothetical protein
MVNQAHESRRGASALGCLFAIMVFVAVLYYGLDLGRIYWNYYRLKDEMESSARFAQTRSDPEILRHLGGIAQDLGLPQEAKRFVIKRSKDPPVVTIKTEYHVEFDLPFQHRVMTMRPEVEVRQ